MEIGCTKLTTMEQAVRNILAGRASHIILDTKIKLSKDGGLSRARTHFNPEH